MTYREMITSPYYGVIEEVIVKKNTRIYEWEPLFEIKTENGTIKSVTVGVSGEVESLEVQEGDKVIPGMVLAYVKEDLLASGSD
ncbi:hypothetical protein WD019_20080 [Fictibacillus sp. Mic-4]|uniref:hypothetical protein n=1 Tax=Fictibacillus TaxID=1329200 RepID=UPI000415F066|nr:hypothetical protein [Fictibacillus gelatini]